MMDEAVVIFGKTARPGNVKTRLCPPLSEEQAARLYEAFARDVFESVGRYVERRASELDDNGAVSGILAWDGGPDESLVEAGRSQWGFELVEQGDGDLGDRLGRVIAQLRQRGVRSVLVVGTDSPTLSMQQLEVARLHLRRCDVIVGPAFDGGYYLIGLHEGPSEGPAPEEVIFDDIKWSTGQVTEQTWRRATESGLLCELLGFWYDIDTFEDLKRAEFHLFEYLASRDPLVGQHTRSHLESESILRLDHESS